MILGVFIGLSFILLASYVCLVAFETSSGVRVLSTTRSKLDRYVERVTFLLKHVDFGSFFSHLFKDIFERVIHDILHAALFVVRFIERILTRGIKEIRARIAPRGVPADEKRSTFVETISYFKKTLRKSKKAATDTQLPRTEV